MKEGEMKQWRKKLMTGENEGETCNHNKSKGEKMKKNKKV